MEQEEMNLLHAGHATGDEAQCLSSLTDLLSYTF